MSATLSLTAEAVEQSIRTHLVKALGDVPLERDPFSHVYVESAFPTAAFHQVSIGLIP